MSRTSTDDPRTSAPARARLGHRYLTFWIGQTVSAIGSVVAGVGVAVWVYVETGNAAWLGLLGALSALPPLLVSPLVPLVDRFPRRTVIIVADTVAASGSVIALVVAAFGELEVWHLIVAGVVANLGSAIQLPALQAAIPELVEPAAIGRANGLNQLGPAAGIVLGPAIATPLVAWWGITAVLLVDVITFAVAVGCTAAVRFADRRRVAVDSEAGTDDGSWRTALRWLSHDGRPIATLMMASALVNCCLAVFNVAVIGVATSVGGTARAGLVLAVGGVAMLAGSLCIGGRGIPERRSRVITTCLVATALGFVVVGSRPSLPLVLLGAAITLGVVPVVSAVVSTVYHERVPASMHGRVFGLRSAASSALYPIGSAAAGLAIAHVAEPTMAPGGFGARTIGDVIGVGAERGAALVMLVAGLALAALAVWLRSRIGNAIDVAGAADESPTSDRTDADPSVTAAPALAG